MNHGAEVIHDVVYRLLASGFTGAHLNLTIHDLQLP